MEVFPRSDWHVTMPAKNFLDGSLLWEDPVPCGCCHLCVSDPGLYKKPVKHEPERAQTIGSLISHRARLMPGSVK